MNINKVKLKLNGEELSVLFRSLTTADPLLVESKEKRLMVKALIAPVIKRLMSRMFTVTPLTEVKFSVIDGEAMAMLLILKTVDLKPYENHYDSIVIHKIIGIIDQKLV